MRSGPATHPKVIAARRESSSVRLGYAARSASRSSAAPRSGAGATYSAGVDDLPRSARRVRDALIALDLDADIHRLADSTRTAPEAAAAVGCELGAIVKSLVMRGAATGAPALVLVSGANRADEALVADALGEPIERPDAAYVREVTGYAIGGIPPLGHPAPVRTVLDEDLLAFATVWAAAGHPHAVFPIEPSVLASATGARVIRLAA